MPRDRTRPVWREVAFGQMQVSTADTTTGDPDQYLPGAGHGCWPLDAHQRAGSDWTRLVDDPRPHRYVVQAPHRTGRDLGAALQVAGQHHPSLLMFLLTQSWSVTTHRDRPKVRTAVQAPGPCVAEAPQRHALIWSGRRTRPTLTGATHADFPDGGRSGSGRARTTTMS
jgi:hypothetical protein